MDLRSPTPIGAIIEDPFMQLEWGSGYDHNYVVDGPFGLLRPCCLGPFGGQRHRPPSGYHPAGSPVLHR